MGRIGIFVCHCGRNIAHTVDIEKVVEELKDDDDGLNRIEMAFRAYDPCLACATHSLPGKMPLEVNIYDSKRRLVKTLKRSI